MSSSSDTERAINTRASRKSIVGSVSRSLLLSLTGGLLCAHAVTAQPVHTIGPQSGSDSIRAARPTGLEPGLAFKLHEEEREGGKLISQTDSAVVLTATATEIKVNATHTVDDYALCRTFVWSAAISGVTGVNCHAAAGFKAIEMQNRRSMQEMLVKMKLNTPPTSNAEYWAQSDLGYADAGQTPLTSRLVGGGIEYRLGDHVVVRTTSAGALEPQERRELVRFLARHARLHPQVRDDLGKSNVFPSRIDFEASPVGRVIQRTLVFSDLHRVQASYPLPTGLSSDLRATASPDKEKAQALKSALDLIDGRRTAPTADAILAQITDAADRKQGLGVVLATTGLILQYPTRVTDPALQFAAKIKPLYAAAMHDPQAVAFLQASNLSGSTQAAGDRQAAARYLAQATSLDAMPYGQFRYVTFANLVRSSPGADRWDAAIFAAMPRPLVDNYWRAIAGYPSISGFYKDLGDSYLRGFDVVNAWLAYDLARAVDPESATAMLSPLDAFEKRLEAEQPEMF